MRRPPTRAASQASSSAGTDSRFARDERAPRIEQGEGLALQGKPLVPKDPYGRALVRTLMKEIELYIELPARSCFAEAFFGGKVPDAIKAKAREDLKAGFATLKRHGRFAPYVAGDTFTLADIVFLYSIDIAASVGKQVFGLDLLGDFPGAQALLQKLGENPHVKAIAAKRDAGMPVFVAAMRARLQGAG